MQPASYHLRRKDEQKLSQLQQENPSIAEPTRSANFTPDVLSIVGIMYRPPVVGKAFLKRFYQDFIVEEITDAGELCTISPATDSPRPYPASEQPKIEATLVKQGVNNFEVSERFSEALNLPLHAISVAGLKDGRGITSQRISFNGTSVEALKHISIPRVFLKDYALRPGLRNSGELYGNRFTLVVRTKHSDLSAVENRIQQVSKEGFLNFFSLQRFGSRLIAHFFGQLILQQRYDEAVHYYLTSISPFETQLMQGFRKKAADAWGNWEEMLNTYNEFPYFFQNEILMVTSLKDQPENPVAAIAAIEVQAKMAIYAFESYAFNLLLSHYAAQQMLPETLMLIYPDPECLKEYEQVLAPELLQTLRWRQPALQFLGRTKRRTVATKVTALHYHTVPCEAGFVMLFDLPKGAYATTYLSDVFELYQGRTVPDWVNETVIDAKLHFGQPSFTETLSAFPVNTEESDFSLEGVGDS